MTSEFDRLIAGLAKRARAMMDAPAMPDTPQKRRGRAHGWRPKPGDVRRLADRYRRGASLLDLLRACRRRDRSINADRLKRILVEAGCTIRGRGRPKGRWRVNPRWKHAKGRVVFLIPRCASFHPNE